MSLQKLELTWIGKEKRPRLEPRILLEDPGKSYQPHRHRNRLDPPTVIPAKAGIQTAFISLKTKIHWIPAYAGMTIFFAFAEMTTFGLRGLNGYQPPVRADFLDNHFVPIRR